MYCTALQRSVAAICLLASLITGGCAEDDGSAPATPAADIYSFANGCYAVEDDSRFLARGSSGYSFSALSIETATPFFLKPSGLGTYLLRDEAGGYLVSDGALLLHETHLESDITMVDDSFESEAEWELQDAGSAGFHLRHLESGSYLAASRQTVSCRNCKRQRSHFEPTPAVPSSPRKAPTRKARSK
jgi:hypothetical protein